MYSSHCMYVLLKQFFYFFDTLLFHDILKYIEKKWGQNQLGISEQYSHQVKLSSQNCDKFQQSYMVRNKNFDKLSCEKKRSSTNPNATASRMEIQSCHPYNGNQLLRKHYCEYTADLE